MKLRIGTHVFLSEPLPVHKSVWLDQHAHAQPPMLNVETAVAHVSLHFASAPLCPIAHACTCLAGLLLDRSCRPCWSLDCPKLFRTNLGNGGGRTDRDDAERHRWRVRHVQGWSPGMCMVGPVRISTCIEWVLELEWRSCILHGFTACFTVVQHAMVY